MWSPTTTPVHFQLAATVQLPGHIQLVLSVETICSSATNAHAAYDLWFNNWKNEVMIQTDFAPSGARCSSYEASATFGGSNGVPVQKWSLCQFGSELIWQMPTNEASGSVDIKAMTTWLENNGYMPQNSTVTAMSYGFEISSTGGQNQTFRVSNFSITT